MPAPSQLTIATSSVLRLLKEEISYHKELVDQEAQAKIQEEKLKSGQNDEDGNGEFMLKQQQTAVEQTKAVFGPLKKRIAEAVQKLEEQLAATDGTGAEAEQAKLILEQAQATQAAAP